MDVQGDHWRQAPLMCSPTKNVTSPPFLLFHIEYERFTKSLISSLVKCRSLKAFLPFHGTPRKGSGHEGRQMQRWNRPSAVRSPSDAHIRGFLSPHSRSMIGDCLQEETGWVFAFLHGNIGLVSFRAGFSNYLSFFAFILG